MSADGDSPLIETVTTTRDGDGTINCAAMGVRFLDTDELVMWPFSPTRTLRNLRARPEAVVHLTDDVLLFVQAALGHPQPPTRPAQVVDGGVIEAAAAWREVRVTDISPAPGELPRFRVTATIVAAGSGTQPPAGLCRARHAAVEASILASRVRWLDAADVDARLAQLTDLVDKTGGPRERAAMDVVRAHVTALR